MKKLLIIPLLLFSIIGFSQTDTALGTNGHYIPLVPLSVPSNYLIAPNSHTIYFDSSKVGVSITKNSTNDSIRLISGSGSILATVKDSVGTSGGGSGSGWKTVNTNDMTDTLSGNVAIGNGLSTPIAKLQINVSGIGATQPDSSKGILLINPTAAISGTQQFSSPIWWQGNSWRNGVSTSSPVGIGAYLKTVQGNTQAVGYLTFLWKGYWSGSPSIKSDLLTIGGSSDGNGFGVGIGTTPSNTAGAVLNVGGSINQVSGNYSISSPWNLNVSGASLIDYTATTFLLRLLNSSTFNGTVTDKPISVGRSDSTDLGAQLSVTSTGRGFLFPRMTTTQRDSIDLRITGFTIANGGTSYTGSGPSLTASAGPTPTGATTAVLSGFIWTISSGVLTGVSGGINFGGSYNSTPTLTPSGGGGSGAVIYPVMTQFITAGMVIYNTTVSSLQQWNGTRWVNLGLSGTATLASGTVTVSTPAARTGAKIFVSCNTPSGTQGFLSVPDASIVSGTSFTINSSNAADNSTVNWTIK